MKDLLPFTPQEKSRQRKPTPLAVWARRTPPQRDIANGRFERLHRQKGGAIVTLLMYSPPHPSPAAIKSFSHKQKNVAHDTPPLPTSSTSSPPRTPPNNIVFRKDGTAKNPRLLRATKKLQNPSRISFSSNLRPLPAKVPPLPPPCFLLWSVFFLPAPATSSLPPYFKTKNRDEQRVLPLRRFFFLGGGLFPRNTTRHIISKPHR